MDLKNKDFLSLFCFIIGIIFIYQSGISITGYSISLDNLGFNIFHIVGVSLIFSSILLFIGRYSLESIVDVEKVKKNRNLYIENSISSFKNYLDKHKGPLPFDFDKEKYESLEDFEKYQEAKEMLSKLTTPFVDYTDNNAIEFMEYFHKTPDVDKISIPGDEGHEMKTKVYFDITDPVLRSLTEKTTENNLIWKVSNKKIYNLTLTGLIGSEGSAYGNVENTSKRYVYLRDRETGARIFLRRLQNNEYDLIAIVSGTQKKKDEYRVFDRIKELYDQEKEKGHYLNGKPFYEIPSQKNNKEDDIEKINEKEN